MKNFLFYALLLLFLNSCRHSESILNHPEEFQKTLAESNVWNKEILIGYSKEDRPIYAYYYNRGGTRKALVMAGIHGSEFYGVDVALAIKDSLDKMNPESFPWSILVIPEVFPDNVKIGRENPTAINYGRKTCEVCQGTDVNCNFCIDPNRQMPALNKWFDVTNDLSYSQKDIELENKYLIAVTQFFNPDRVATLHCKNEQFKHEIGIYADPRTTLNNISLGFSEDSILVFKMATLVKENGGIINGNFDVFDIDSLNVLPFIAAYPQDPLVAEKGKTQVRSYELEGSKGLTFGTWSSSEIWVDNELKKKAAQTFTFELPQYSLFLLNETISKKENTEAYKKAIFKIFLGDN
jgi:hypothetical protein